MTADEWQGRIYLRLYPFITIYTLYKQLYVILQFVGPFIFSFTYPACDFVKFTSIEG